MPREFGLMIRIHEAVIPLKKKPILYTTLHDSVPWKSFQIRMRWLWNGGYKHQYALSDCVYLVSNQMTVSAVRDEGKSEHIFYREIVNKVSFTNKFN